MKSMTVLSSRRYPRGLVKTSLFLPCAARCIQVQNSRTYFVHSRELTCCSHSSSPSSHHGESGAPKTCDVVLSLTDQWKALRRRKKNTNPLHWSLALDLLKDKRNAEGLEEGYLEALASGLSPSRASLLLQHLLWTLMKLNAPVHVCSGVYVTYRSLIQSGGKDNSLVINRDVMVPLEALGAAQAMKASSYVEPTIHNPFFSKGLYYHYARYVHQQCSKEPDRETRLKLLTNALEILLVDAPSDKCPLSTSPLVLLLSLHILRDWNYLFSELRKQSSLQNISQENYTPFFFWLSSSASVAAVSNRTGSDERAGCASFAPRKLRKVERIALGLLVRLASYPNTNMHDMETGVELYLRLFTSRVSAERFERDNNLLIVLHEEVMWYVNFLSFLDCKTGGENARDFYFSDDVNPEFLQMSDADFEKSVQRIKVAFYISNFHLPLKTPVSSIDKVNGLESSAGIVRMVAHLLEFLAAIKKAELMHSNPFSSEKDPCHKHSFCWAEQSDLVCKYLQLLFILWGSTNKLAPASSKGAKKRYRKNREQVWSLLLEKTRDGVFFTNEQRAHHKSESAVNDPSVKHQGREDAVKGVILPFYSPEDWDERSVNKFILLLDEQGYSKMLRDVFYSIQKVELEQLIAAKRFFLQPQRDEKSGGSIFDLSKRGSAKAAKHEISTRNLVVSYRLKLSFTSCSRILYHCCDKLNDPLCGKEVLQYLLIKLLVSRENGTHEKEGCIRMWRQWVTEKGIPLVEGAVERSGSKYHLPQKCLRD